MMSEPHPSFSRARKWNITLNTALLVLSVVALLTMMNYLAARHHSRFDWSGTGRIELSPLTRQVLASVTNELRVTLYFDREDPLFKLSLGLLKAYSGANPRIVIEVIDYTRDTSTALAAKKKYNLVEKNDRDLVIFDCQDRTKFVYQGELSDLDMNEMLAGRSSEIKRVAFKGEMLFTSAILSVLTPRQLKAYFLEGHDEHNPASDDGLMGYSKFAGVLRENGVKFETLQLEGAAEIPSDCNLLIVAGPRQGMLPLVVAKIDRYLKQGGRLFALFNFNSGTRDTGLERTLAEWGVVVGRNRVLDEDFAVSPDKQDMVVSRFGAHRMVRPLFGSMLYLLRPRTISRDKSPARGADTPQVEEIVFTSAGGRTIENIRSDGSPSPSSDDPIGFTPLIVAVERGGVRNVSAERGATRIVVAGDSIFLANDTIDKAANHEFASHAVNWLLAREELLIGIPPRPIKEYKLTMSRAQMISVQWILLAGMPGGALLLGGLVWLRRRR
jgi:hypothetical protein